MLWHAHIKLSLELSMTCYYLCWCSMLMISDLIILVDSLSISLIGMGLSITPIAGVKLPPALGTWLWGAVYVRAPAAKQEALGSIPGSFFLFQLAY